MEQGNDSQMVGLQSAVQLVGLWLTYIVPSFASNTTRSKYFLSSPIPVEYPFVRPVLLLDATGPTHRFRLCRHPFVPLLALPANA